MLVFAAASCGGSALTTPASLSATATAAPSPTAVATALPQVAFPTPSLATGMCTRPGMTNTDLILRWLELAGKHDAPAVRDCFAASYGVPDAIVTRWAGLGSVTSSQVGHAVTDVSNGCDHFGVRATFPNGNPYAAVQGPTDMFLVVGVGTDGDRPRIFGTATADVQRSPDVTPHTGPPDCR